MHVLMISLDPALLNAESDSYRRHVEYARLAGRVTIFVLTRTQPQTAPKNTDTLTLIPVISRHAARYVFDALRVPIPPDIDLIVTQDLFLSGLIGVLKRASRRVPLLVQNHSFIFDNPAWLAEHPARNRVLIVLAGWVLRRADFYRTVNQRERENAVQRGFPPDRVTALPLATAAAYFAKPVDPAVLDAMRSRLNIAPDDHVILWAGYPVAFKRIDLFAPIFSRVLSADPAARLVLVGINQPIAFPPEIAHRVTQHPPIPHDGLPAVYKLAHVYAMPSAYEGVPRVLFEASAAGVPMIGFDVTGVNEVIREGENGCLLPDGDLDGFARRVVELLTDPERRQIFGAAGQKRAFDKYDAAGYPARWVAVWREALAKGRR